jgi:hypothetical protein
MLPDHNPHGSDVNFEDRRQREQHSLVLKDEIMKII